MGEQMKKKRGRKENNFSSNTTDFVIILYLLNFLNNLKKQVCNEAHWTKKNIEGQGMWG
jgi:hypothetical protein